jgi:hypothetical protein
MNPCPCPCSLRPRRPSAKSRRPITTSDTGYGRRTTRSRGRGGWFVGPRWSRMGFSELAGVFFSFSFF